jgi:5'-deoxynucleotidase YfbR-like HD superfamily hydrolase
MNLQHAVALAQVALTFGQVTRSTQHPDGAPESDPTHTVMLTLIAAEFAEEMGLDVGLTVQHAAVHDIPETYSGDVCTARGLSQTEAFLKAQREQESTQRLQHELGADSWVVRRIRRYERQTEPEARLVRYLDKVLPKLTHLLNHGAALRALGMTVEETVSAHRRQGEKLAQEYPEFPKIQQLFKEACSKVERVMREP